MRWLIAWLLACMFLGLINSSGARGDRTLLIHGDGTYESCYAAEGPECMPPDYGAFAECYQTVAQIHAIVVDLTYVYFPVVHSADVYLWYDEGGCPGEVLALITGCWVDGAPWGDWYRNVIDLSAPVCVGAPWWVGYWMLWSDAWTQYYLCADVNGPGGGSPMYKIAPGLEWPEGWQPVEVRWGRTAALGIGAEVEETPSPVTAETWGTIKEFFRDGPR
jgi:hypothetical protein